MRGSKGLERWFCVLVFVVFVKDLSLVFSFIWNSLKLFVISELDIIF